METYSTQITDYLLTQSWQIAILVAAVAVVSWLLKNKSAHVRYLLWLIVLAKCLVPPLLTVPLAVLPQERATPLWQLRTPPAMIAEPVALPPAPQVSPPAPVAVRPRTRLNMRQWLSGGWIAGVGVFVVVAVLKALQTTFWLRRERKLLPAELQAAIEKLFCELGALPKVWLIDGIGQPFAWGFLRGSIYLPANFVTIIGAERRKSILGHELCHILRFDATVNLLQVIAQAIFWFHPFVWWANKKIRAEREKCCDEMAIARLGAKVKDYSIAIVNILVEEYESTRAVPSLAIAGPVKNIEERIKTIMRPGKKFYKRPSFTVAITVLLLATVAVPTTLALTRRRAEKTDAQVEQAKGRTDAEVKGRVVSREKLKKLGLFLAMYTADHQGKLPDDLRELRAYVTNEDAVELAPFVREDVEYVGKGKIANDSPQTVAVIYDRDLLQRADGTNVLFADAHVEFIKSDRLEKLGIVEKSNIEVLDVEFEPIHQGKNVVHVQVDNNSDKEQTFGIHIQTRSPDYGRHGIGWGRPFFDQIGPRETKWIRCAFEIQGPITDSTWIRLQFYNPISVQGYDFDKWFKKDMYYSKDVEKLEVSEESVVPASQKDSEAATETFLQIQTFIKDKRYEQAWQILTEDHKNAAQVDTLERFIKNMEEPAYARFYWDKEQFIELKPKLVTTKDGMLTLKAIREGQVWTIDFAKQGGQWKVDWVGGYIPAIVRNQLAEQRQNPESAANVDLEILDVKFEPIRQGKNVVHLKVRNSFDKDQTFGVDIRAEAPIRNWQRQFLDSIKGSETKSKSFDFEILGPITDAISIRLRFYNPPSFDEFDIKSWFKEIRYTYDDLDQLGILQERSEPASESQAEAVANTFRQFQSCLKEGKYEAVWGLLTRHIRSSQFQDDFEKFKEQFSDDRAKTIFLNLYPESVTKSGRFLTLSAEDGDQTWKIHFIKEDGQWKIYQGQEPDRSNWQERLLPKMQKRVTKHFDIYYFKNSTAEKEIEQIAERKEKGFQQICQFLGKDSDVRIRMVLFEDGDTKQRETGHQGAGWAFGNTIVEVYNEKEKLDPYHETTHVLMRPYGNPPALFNEGFAVYMSERLGAQALKNLSGGPATIYQRVKELKKKNEWIELEELITYTEIGSRESRPPISYAEAASFVKCLIDKYGKDKFLQAYKTLKNSNEKSTQQQNTKTLEQIYGQSLKQLEQKWIDTFSKD